MTTGRDSCLGCLILFAIIAVANIVFWGALVFVIALIPQDRVQPSLLIHQETY